MAKVLVVHDADETLSFLTRQLTEQGYEVVVAHNGRQALELVAAESLDVVLLAVHLPEMDGTEACRRLKADAAFCAIPVLMLTAEGDNDDIINGLYAGADDYIAKPFHQEILAARVRWAMHIKRDEDTIARMNEQLRTEIVHRREVETDARSLEQYLQIILRVTKAALCVIDADYVLRYVDSAQRAIYGDPSGRKCYEYLLGHDAPCTDCALATALSTKSIVEGELVLVKENNRKVQTTTIPFVSEDGQSLIAQVSMDIGPP